MRAYTDVELTFTVEGLDLTEINNPYLTFTQKIERPMYKDIVNSVTVSNITIIDAGHFSAILTQEQSSIFVEGEGEVQLNYFNSDGLRKATEISKFDVGEQLLNRVIHTVGDNDDNITSE